MHRVLSIIIAHTQRKEIIIVGHLKFSNKIWYISNCLTTSTATLKLNIHRMVYVHTYIFILTLSILRIVIYVAIIPVYVYRISIKTGRREFIL